MNLGNTIGRRIKVKPKPTPAGCFNVNSEHDWIIGGQPTDGRERGSKYQLETYHIGKPAGIKKRYF